MAFIRNSNNYPTIQAALLRAEQQKLIYESKLVGKQFLYVFVNDSQRIDSKKVVFNQHHYLHLTGLDYKGIQSKKRANVIRSDFPTDATEFYQRLGTDVSLINDVSFIVGTTQGETNDYYQYTQHKLDNLSQLTAIASKASYIGKYKGKLSFDIIINRNYSSIAFVPDKNILVPISSLYGTPHSLATNIRDVLAIFSREQGQDFKLEYLNADVNIGNKLFSEETLGLLKPTSFINPDVKFNQSQLAALVHSFEVSIEKQIKRTLDELSAEYHSDDLDIDAFIAKQDAFLSSLDTDFKRNAASKHIEKEADNNPFFADVRKSLTATEVSDDNSTIPVAMGGKPTTTNITSTDKTPSVQMSVNADGTIAVQNNFQFQFPTPDDFIKAVKDTVAYIGNAINTFELKVSKALNEVFNSPKSKPKSVSKARTTKSDKSTTPKKKAVKTPQSVSERKPVKQVAQDKPKAQEKKPSVIGGIKEIKAEQAKEPKTPPKERSANKNKNRGL